MTAVDVCLADFKLGFSSGISWKETQEKLTCFIDLSAEI